MENKKAVAKTKFLKISQRKTMGTCNLVRNLHVDMAKSVLMRTPNKASGFILKTLESAVSNAKNKNMDGKKLFISRISADMGPAYKRSIPWSKGNVRPIKKRTIHLMIELEERIDKKAAVAKTEKKEDPAIKEKGKSVKAEKTSEKVDVKKKTKKESTGKVKATVKKIEK